MLYVHPAFMLLATALMVYVLRLGLVRLMATRFGREGVFHWKRHVQLGKVVMAAFALGACGGLAFTWSQWSAPLKTGTHAALAGVILALATLGTLTGLSMDKTRKRGNPMALVHGIGNMVMAALAALQVYTGVGVLRDWAW